MSAAPAIFTVGHSTRALEELIELLWSAGVATLCDVRRFPASRRHPHFARDALAKSLPAAGVAYLHLPDLGGRRRSEISSDQNAGWRNPSFRAYADHLSSREFERGLAQVLAAAPAAVMCAESVPWRCHRWLISDALTARGIEVTHLLGPGQRRVHSLSSFARVGPPPRYAVTYPPAPSPGDQLPLL